MGRWVEAALLCGLLPGSLGWASGPRPLIVETASKTATAISSIAFLPLETIPGPAAEVTVDDSGPPSLVRIWTGIGEAMFTVGLSLDLVWISEVSGNLRGGLKREANVLHYGDLALGWDLDRLAGWTGASLMVRLFTSFGGSPSEAAGDFQFSSNLENGDTVRLYEAWLEQCFDEGTLCLLAGVYEIANDFQFVDASSVFLHSSHFLGAALYWSGENGPSAQPSTALSARVKFALTESLYFLGSVSDGVPGAVGDPSRAGYALRKEEGVHALFEGGYVFGAGSDARPAGKVALGLWRYTTRLPVLGADSERTQLGANGAYALFESRVVAPPDQTEGLWLWARAGLADARVNPVSRFLGAGLTYRGLAGEGEEDAAGLAVAAAFVSDGFRRELAAEREITAPSEVAVEATYRTGLAPWLALQLSLHWIHHPSFQRRVRDSVGLAGRLELSL